MNLEYFELIAQDAALEAGEEILRIYNSAELGIESKSDNSPITLADKKAHLIINKHLLKTNLPILCEEGSHANYKERKNWEYFWMVDPLDGTSEFIKRNGEFTVNIALIHQNRPILGVLYVPVLEKLYSAIQNKGAFLKFESQITQIHTKPQASESIHIIASRSNSNQQTKDFIAQYPFSNLVCMGSSLKFALLAEGKANIYPRFSKTMEWDTAAAQIIVEEAGGKVLNYETNEPLTYNKPELGNPFFIVYDC